MSTEKPINVAIENNPINTNAELFSILRDIRKTLKAEASRSKQSTDETSSKETTSTDNVGKTISDKTAIKLAQTPGKGIFSALKEALVERRKEKTDALKKMFDPLNIIKSITGGSKLAGVLAGKLLGRSEEEIREQAGIESITPESPETVAKNPGEISGIGNLLKTLNVIAVRVDQIADSMGATPKVNKMGRLYENTEKGARFLGKEQAAQETAMLDALLAIKKSQAESVSLEKKRLNLDEKKAKEDEKQRDAEREQNMEQLRILKNSVGGAGIARSKSPTQYIDFFSRNPGMNPSNNPDPGGGGGGFWKWIGDAAGSLATLWGANKIFKGANKIFNWAKTKVPPISPSSPGLMPQPFKTPAPRAPAGAPGFWGAGGAASEAGAVLARGISGLGAASLFFSLGGDAQIMPTSERSPTQNNDNVASIPGIPDSEISDKTRYLKLHDELLKRGGPNSLDPKNEDWHKSFLETINKEKNKAIETERMKHRDPFAADTDSPDSLFREKLQVKGQTTEELVTQLWREAYFKHYKDKFGDMWSGLSSYFHPSDKKKEITESNVAKPSANIWESTMNRWGLQQQSSDPSKLSKLVQEIPRVDGEKLNNGSKMNTANIQENQNPVARTDSGSVVNNVVNNSTPQTTIMGNFMSNPRTTESTWLRRQHENYPAL